MDGWLVGWFVGSFVSIGKNDVNSKIRNYTVALLKRNKLADTLLLLLLFFLSLVVVVVVVWWPFIADYSVRLMSLLSVWTVG